MSYALSPQEKCRIVGLMLYLFVIAVSSLMWFGWIFDLPALTRLWLQMPPMRANTACCFILSGSALYLIAQKNVRPATYYLAKSMIVVAVLLSAYSIIEYMLPSNFNIDIWLIDKKIVYDYPASDIHMTLLSSINFFLIGGVFFWMDHKLWRPAYFQMLTITLLSMSCFSLVGNFYQLDPHYEREKYFIMSWLASLLFIFISVGMRLIKPEIGIIHLILQQNIAGRFMRKIAPFLILVPILIAYLVNIGIHHGFYDDNFGDVIALMGSVIGLTISSYFIAKKLDTTEKKLQESEQVFKVYAEKTDLVFYRMSPKLDKILYISPAFEKIWGWPCRMLYKDPSLWMKAVVAEDQSQVNEVLIQKLTTKLGVSLEFRITRSDGEIRRIYARAFQVRNQENHVLYIIGIATDVTENYHLKRYSQAQLDILMLFKNIKTLNEIASPLLKIICLAMDCVLAEIWIINEEKKSMSCLGFWHALSINMDSYYQEKLQKSLPMSDAIIKKINALKMSVWEPAVIQKSDFICKMDLMSMNLKGVLKIPILRDEQVRGFIVLYRHQPIKPDNMTLNFIKSIEARLRFFMQDTTKEDAINHMTKYDFLTGCLNRKYYENSVDMLIRNQFVRRAIILIFDIDRFSTINEVFGIDGGNLLLQLVTQRIQKSNTFSEVVMARLEADKFSLYFPIPDELNDNHHIFNAFLSEFKENFILDDKEVYLTISIGAAIYPQDGLNMKILLKNAYIALMRSKNIGGDNCQLYEEQLHLKVSKKLNLETEIRQALNRNEFILYYQPQISLADKKICGVEALIRWQHPKKGLILPNEFISIAEATGLIIPLGEWIFGEVCRQINLGWPGWQSSPKDPVELNSIIKPIAVNISAEQFKESYHLVTFLARIIDDYGINPRAIELEITESVLLQETQHHLEQLTRLKNMGFNLVLDDFGTGYTALNYLSQIPASTIKIDKSFIDGIPNNMDKINMVSAFISLFKKLGKTVIAEGVETEAQVKFLINEGCDIIQGYYFSKPLPLAEVKILIQSQKKWILP